MSKKKAKLSSTELLKRTKAAVEKGDYLDTSHASQRKGQRKILRMEVEYVLKHGWHEKKKDSFEDAYQAWNYAIRGKTIDKRNLRIAVSFEEKMLVITAIDLDQE